MHKLKEILSRTPSWERRFARKFQLLAVARMNELLEKSPYTQQDIAAKTGWDKSYVSRLLTGGGNLTLKTVARFEDALGEDVLMVTGKPHGSQHRHWVRPSSGEPVVGPAVTRTVVGTPVKRVTVYAGAHE
ncbi:MAG TPA: XRE family transcriptional regulator [Bacteroidetes bacterium]|nr:XRE family transcriptional regulator [Bacteroidota bacterium]